MFRFASFVLLAACASAPAKPQPGPIANQTTATTVFHLAPTYLPPLVGRHSARHSSAQVSGTLELAGERALVTLEIASSVGYVLCPTNRDRWPARQACVESAPADSGTQTTKRKLPGTAKLRAGQLHIEASVTEQPNPAEPPRTIRLELECDDRHDSLICKPITESRFDFLGSVDQLEFHRKPATDSRA
jgi:hypothetical protein